MTRKNKMKEILNKEICNLDNLIMNLEYELSKGYYSKDEMELMNNIIEKYGSIRQELIEKVGKINYGI